MIRYRENIDNLVFTEDTQNLLLTKHIAVIGCGGQGGYTLEYLARLGVKEISFWDGDIYEESNLNRQIGCLTSTLNQYKAIVLKNRIQDINPKIKVNCYNWFFGDKTTDIEYLLKADFIFTAADCHYNLLQFRELLKIAIKHDIPVIDYPVNVLGGWVRIETKRDLSHFDFMTSMLIKQYQREQKSKDRVSQPAFKCAIIAGEAVNQMVQYFANQRYAYIDANLNIDLYHHKYIEEDRFGIIP